MSTLDAIALAAMAAFAVVGMFLPFLVESGRRDGIVRTGHGDTDE